MIAQLDVPKVLNIGRNALYFRDYVVAIGYFNQVLELRPWMAEPYLLRAHAKLMLDDYEGARTDATASLERNAFIGSAYLIRALASHALEDFPQAEQDYRKALSLNPDDDGIRFNLASTLYEQKLYPDADSLARQIPPNAKTYPISQILRGDIALKQGDTIAAKELSDLALQKDSTLVQAYAFKADLYRHRESYTEAIVMLDRAIEGDPNNAGFYINRGLMFYLNNDYVKAIQDYNQAISLDSGNKTALYNRGLLRGFLGDLNNALNDLHLVLDIDPSNDMARYNVALLETRLGFYDDAVSNFSKVLESYPDFLLGYLARSEAKQLNGDEKGSQEDRFYAYKLEKKSRNTKKQQKNRQKTPNPTRNEEEKTIENYQSLIAGDATLLTKEAALPESLRGRIQDEQVAISPMGFYYLTFFLPENLLQTCKFDAQISQFNERSSEDKTLCSTAIALPLDSLQTQNASNRLNDLNSSVQEKSDYYLIRGLYKYALVDLEGALSDFNMALELRKDFGLALFARAFTQLRLLDLQEKSRDFKEEDSSEYHPETMMGKKLSNNTNSSLVRLQDNTFYAYQEVARDLDRLIFLYPDMAIALYNRALLYERQGMKEKALELYSRLLTLQNTPPEAYFNRGLIYLSLGKRSEAVRDLSKAGELGIYQSYNILKRLQ